MKFILNKRIKYYTKESFKWIGLIVIALLIILAFVFFNYQFAFEVIMDGETVGYIDNKEMIENRIQELLDLEGTDNIAFVDLPAEPEYHLTLVDKHQEVDTTTVLAKIEENTKITYEYYGVTLNGKQETVVASLEEAETLVAELKKKYTNNIDVTIGIEELYSEDGEEYKAVEVATAKKQVTTEIQKMASSSVNGVYLAQKPVTGIITSRFGSRESIRSFPHNGLDIAAPYGTKIKAAADGTVTFSGYNGSYGNLVIVDCGHGVEIYYGHASKLLAKVGTKVEAGDVIAEVGSTGNSTGNHLHFEIKINGVSVNPQNYIYK